MSFVREILWPRDDGNVKTVLHEWTLKSFVISQLSNLANDILQTKYKLCSRRAPYNQLVQYEMQDLSPFIKWFEKDTKYNSKSGNKDYESTT